MYVGLKSCRPTLDHTIHVETTLTFTTHLSMNTDFLLPGLSCKNNIPWLLCLFPPTAGKCAPTAQQHIWSVALASNSPRSLSDQTPFKCAGQTGPNPGLLESMSQQIGAFIFSKWYQANDDESLAGWYMINMVLEHQLDEYLLLEFIFF